MTSRAEYQRGMMDVVNEPAVDMVVIMSSAQIGKTEILNNIIGYYIDQDPAPILILQPTIEMAEAWSKDRLTPMIRDTEALTPKFGDPKRKDSDNRILHKMFPGGHITMAGGNSPASLASRPIRILCCDEVDRYPASAGSEGDPVNLAKKRTTTFWNRKTILVSTPTVKGISRIEAAFDKSDKRFFFVPCPHCKVSQPLQWREGERFKGHLVWQDNNPETAQYLCGECGGHIEESEKPRMIANGAWQATAEFKGTAGFFINELYSPWVRWADMVANFLQAKQDPRQLQTFINTSLGETWEDASETINPHDLMVRREHYTKVPYGACVLTAGVDVQDDRLELEVVAWGAGQESWSMAYKIIYGNPAESEIWKELDAFLLKKMEHESGQALPIACVCIDSGGHFTNEVYQFCKQRQVRRVFAIKGHSIAGAPVVGKPTRNNKGRVTLFMVGTDAAKSTLYGRFKIDEPGAGYCHFSHAANDEEFFKQLTSERLANDYVKGFLKRGWKKADRARNEALDCRVYALAAVEILNPDYPALLTHLKADGTDAPPQPEAPESQQPVRKPAKPQPIKRNFATSWKI